MTTTDRGGFAIVLLVRISLLKLSVEVFGTAVLIENTETDSKQIFQMEQKLVKNPIWRETDRLAVYKAWSLIWNHRTQLHLAAGGRIQSLELQPQFVKTSFQIGARCSVFIALRRGIHRKKNSFKKTDFDGKKERKKIMGDPGN